MTVPAAPARGLPAVLPTIARPELRRPRQGRMIGGVAVGLAAHLGRPVRAVRILLVLLSLVSGAGVILYGWLWAMVPTGESDRADAADVADRPPIGRRSTSPLGDLALGLLLLITAASLIGARLGWTPAPTMVVPVLVVIGGAVLAYSQLDEVERSRWAARAGGGGRAAVLRVVAGLVIVLVGVLLVVVQQVDVASASRVMIATVAVLGGAALVLAPWGVRIWHDLDAERAARVREAERADIAAHLHDSVLQTLALIQRHSGDGAQVARLARAQERDLREWLYGSHPAADATFAGQVRGAAAEVEDRHGVAVDVVMVGDRPADDQALVLVAALREAMVNAVRHAGAPVSVYVEVGPDGVEAFVRDRGPGFDLAAVPADRLGIRESIVGRMQRHGGSATVKTGADGTEVALLLPSGEPEPHGNGGPDPDPVPAARDPQRPDASPADGRSEVRP